MQTMTVQPESATRKITSALHLTLVEATRGQPVPISRRLFPGGLLSSRARLGQTSETENTGAADRFGAAIAPHPTTKRRPVIRQSRS